MPVVALAEIGAVVLAFIALGVLLGAQALAKLLVSLLKHVPLAGGWIASHVESEVVNVIGDLTAWVESVVSSAEGWLLQPIRALRWLFDQLMNHLGENIQAHQRAAANLNLSQGFLQANIDREAVTRNWQINTTASNLQANINAVALQAMAEAVLVAQQATGLIAAVGTSLQHNIDTEAVTRNWQVDTTASNLQANINAVALHAQTELVTLAQQVTGLIATVAHDLQVNIDLTATNALTAATQLSTEAEKGAVSGVDATAGAVGAATWPIALPGLQGLIAGLDNIIPGYGAGTIPIPEAVPATLAQMLVGTMAGVHALADFANACSIPQCETLRPFEPSLKGLTSLIEGGALVAFLAAAVADPTGVAHDIEATVGTLVNDTASALAGAVGL